MRIYRKSYENLAKSNPDKLNEMIQNFETIRGEGYGEISQPKFD